MAIEISVIFAVRNEIKNIENAINSIYKQTFPIENIEIIFVDGMSNDGTFEYLNNIQSSRKNIIVERNPKISSASGWNMGIDLARGKYILIMSGHAEISLQYLQFCYEILEASNYAAVAGPTIPIGINRFSNQLALALKSSFGVGNASYFTSTENRVVETLVFGLYRREVLIKVNKFDESIIRGQDWDLNFRIRNQGFKLYQIGCVNSKYYVRTSLISLWKRHFNAGKWKVYILKKYPHSLLLRHVIPFMFVLVLFFLIAGALFSNFIKFILIGFLLIYLFIGSFFALVTIHKNQEGQLAWILLLFFIMHFSYGIGMFQGIMQFLFLSRFKKYFFTD